jgi:hypothetical protein
MDRPTGNCDSGCGKLAKYWVGRTAMAHCGDAKCEEIQDQRYQEHCAEMDEKFEFERQMKEEFGDDWDS